MHGRAARRLIGVVAMLLGGMMIRGMIDATPLIGSPQIDYPGLNLDWPFWPQLALQWLTVGLTAAVVVALGMTAWSDGQNGPTLKRVALVWAAWFTMIALASLLMFMTFGTMGPLHVQQPIYRFSLINAALSATLIATIYCLVCLVLHRTSALGGTAIRATVAFFVTAAFFSLAVVTIAVPSGMPLGRVFGYFLSGIAVFAAAISFLVAIQPRARSK
jgi:hypothetical protein